MAQRPGDHIADPGLLSGQQARGDLDDGDVAAEASECLAQLAADRAATEHQQPVGALGRRQRVGAGPQRAGRQRVDAVHRWHDRCASGADHEGAGPAQLHAVAVRGDHVDGAGGGHRAGAADQPDTRADQGVGGRGVVAVLGCGVSSAYSFVPTHAGRRGHQQRLAGDAGDVGALATDAERLEHRDVDTRAGQRLGDRLPARPGPEHDDGGGQLLSHDTSLPGAWTVRT